MKRLQNFPHLLSPSTLTLHEAMGRMNDTVELFQLIVDDRGKLLGTMSDGDIRRALLRGVTLVDPVTACMNRKPITGRTGNDSTNRKTLEAMDASAFYLPIVDASGIVREVILNTHSSESITTALIMAGGLGTRLGERTRNTAKPLIHIGDKPILEHILAALEAARFEQIYISVNYLAEQIEAFVGARENSTRVDLLHEQSRLGTAGALGNLPEAPKGPVLVINGDVMTKIDYDALRSFHRRHNYDATIAVATHHYDVPYGVVRHDENGLFLGIEEKPRITRFIAAGIYCLSPEFCALVTPQNPVDMPELLNTGRKAGMKVGLFPIHEYWIDVGNPDDLQTAHENQLADMKKGQMESMSDD